MLLVAAEHDATGTGFKFTLSALISHVVALACALEFNFARRGEAESLRGGLFCFLLHDFLCLPQRDGDHCPQGVDGSRFFKRFDTDRVPAGDGPTGAAAV